MRGSLKKSVLAAALLFAGSSSAADLGVLFNPETGPVDPESCVSYTVRIWTSDITRGGTDEAPSIRIDGTDGTTGRIVFSDPFTGQDWQITEGANVDTLCANAAGQAMAFVNESAANASNRFETGNTDTFVILGPPVGTIAGIEIGLPGAAGTAAAAWHLAKVEISGPKNADAPVRFVYNGWIEAGQMVSLGPSGQTADYRISVRTGDAQGAGTDANIRLKIEGIDNLGQGVDIFDGVVNGLISGNAFERASESVFVLKDLPAMARIRAVTVTSDDAGAGSDWMLARIEVSAPGVCGGWPNGQCEYGSPEVFVFDTWVQAGKLTHARAAESLLPPPPAKTPARDVIRDVTNLRLLSCARAYSVHTGVPAAEATPCLGNDVYGPYSLDYLACIYVETEGQSEARIPASVAACDAKFPEDAANGRAAQTATGAQPAASAPQAGGMSEEERCVSMVDGQVAWDQAGSTDWNPGNVAALCQGATDAEERIACFRAGIAAHGEWVRAIADCTGADGASATDAEPPPAEAGPQETVAPDQDGLACDTALEDQCKALLQGQVPWTLSNAENPATRTWEPENLDRLCACTPDPAQTVQCFQNALYEIESTGQGGWYEAMEACRVP
jgi:hypothetical protein